ncbi:hypothetical protein [Nodosilinea nodulosa]|uniref:hypothetical protein n=1 Tax=Nodosilinea nodulosa TaxID=416001 RepID=UPI00035C1A44|nr:hypothetical protein [Nodosilinea nodulosa]
MVQDVRFLTDESGERVAVLLDLATYQQLMASNNDPELLTSLNSHELTALAESALSLETQAHLTDLLERNTEGQLLTNELADLDQLLAQVDYLNILKARARYTLEHSSQIDALAS